MYIWSDALGRDKEPRDWGFVALIVFVIAITAVNWLLFTVIYNVCNM